MIRLRSVSQKETRWAVGTVMRENAKSSGAHADRADVRVEPTNSRPQGPRFANTHPVSNEAQPRVEIIHFWAPSRPGDEPPVGGWSKRAFDIAVSASALLLFAPLLLLIALIVRLDSAGAAVFKQERGGYRGKTFKIWKFRTMTVTENRGVVQARSGDARFTRIGGFLRRTSLDELPQLINVLMGDMSIIGPRPHALEHDIKFEKVDGRYPIRFRARPGVTGLAQVNGSRGPTETEEKICTRTGFDAEYVQAWSWSRELEILGRTAAILTKYDPAAL
jgi:putative colanic acid biosysnthesis UDP-glucose lipid carrier transferase